uniref:Uncharacterized protein n=1 Tax=Setaria italica TaxID=4555 RepID=K3YEJ6_SETIT
MSCGGKLSRQSLHLVLREGRDLYSLRHLDVPNLFYPSTAQALEAEAKSKMTEKLQQNGINKIGAIGRLAGPSIHYQPSTRTANPYKIGHHAPNLKESGISETTAGRLLHWAAIRCLGSVYLRPLASDSNSIFYAESRSLTAMPELNSAKGTAVWPSPYRPRVVQLRGARRAYDPVDHWCWGPLPKPPFFEDKRYEGPLQARFAVVGGTRICVSTTTATYAFDTATDKWNKVGDWVLPFTRAEYVPELGLWLGLSSDGGGGPYDLCTLENLSADAGSSPPTVRHIGREFELPEDWWEVTGDLVWLGERRFCIASSFMVENERDEYDSVPVTVFTGVEVLPGGERGLHQMVKHKAECFVAGFRFVL